MIAVGGLESAWEGASRELPMGWYLRGVSVRPGLGADERWEASAWGPTRSDRLYVYGSTPTDAMHALAEALIEARRSGR